MEAILLKITEKYWLKYRSIPFVVIVAAAFCVPFIPKTGEESFLQVVIAAAIGIAVNLFYLFCCISANKLPRAKKGKTAVLFVVDAESEQLYKDVKNKLINSYNAFITGRDNPVEVSLSSGQKAYVFAEAHCGAMGTLNRSRLKDPDGTNGIALQMKDWARIKDCLDEMA